MRPSLGHTQPGAPLVAALVEQLKRARRLSTSPTSNPCDPQRRLHPHTTLIRASRLYSVWPDVLRACERMPSASGEPYGSNVWFLCHYHGTSPREMQYQSAELTLTASLSPR